MLYVVWYDCRLGRNLFPEENFDANSHKQPLGIKKFHQVVQEFTTVLETAVPTPFHHMLADQTKEESYCVFIP
jgi:hypothetical protein